MKSGNLVRRVVRILHEFFGEFIVLLTIVAGCLWIYKARLIIPTLLAHEKEVELIARLITVALGVIGSLIAYRAFFSGRLFIERANIRGAVSQITKLSSGRVLYALNVEMHNIGTRAIWDPVVNVWVRGIAVSGDKLVEVESEPGETSRPTTVLGIEPGETDQFHFRFSVDQKIEAFRVNVTVTTSSRKQWCWATTIAHG